MEARFLCVGRCAIIVDVDDFYRNDLILIMNPPDFKWNIQMKKQKTRMFTGTNCEYLGTFMYEDVTVV